MASCRILNTRTRLKQSLIMLLSRWNTQQFLSRHQSLVFLFLPLSTLPLMLLVPRLPISPVRRSGSETMITTRKNISIKPLPPTGIQHPFCTISCGSIQVRAIQWRNFLDVNTSDVYHSVYGSYELHFLVTFQRVTLGWRDQCFSYM